MAVISDCVDIDAPPSKVWAILADVKRLPAYSTSTVEVRGAPDCLDHKGQTFTQVVKAIGRRWSSQWTVLDYREGELLSSEGSVAPGVRLRLTQRLSKRAGGGSTLRLDIRYQVPGGALGRLASKAGLEARAPREAAAVLDGIRTAAESGAA